MSAHSAAVAFPGTSGLALLDLISCLDEFSRGSAIRSPLGLM